jgi:archaellum component FlaF (FlaF/FlaG flagellin family)
MLKRKNGEGYIDVAVSIMLIAFSLVFMVNIVSLVALNQNIKTAADQIAEYASYNGSIDIASYVKEQRAKLGVDFTCSFDGTQTIGSTKHVQLGDRIECKLTYQLNFLGFGEAVHLFTINASASGISEVYWK